MERENVRLVTADQVDRAALGDFLDRMYPPAKSHFLKQYGAWLHGGDENRWVLVVGEQEIAGYCAVIPARFLVNGVEQQAIWWVDLVIDPTCRGQGLQTLFDARVREMGVLKLGFPNEFAAKIHRKHGWGVRDDLRFFLAPLRPSGMRQIRQAQGRAGNLLRLGAIMSAPAAAAWRKFLFHRGVGTARQVQNSTPQQLAEIFQRFSTVSNTTLRDEAYLRWRFFDAPYRNELRYYVAGPMDAPELAVVARWLESSGRHSVRILDVFGRLEDQQLLGNTLRLVIREAVEWGAVQVTALASLEALYPVFRRTGFVLSSPARFCWYSDDSETRHGLEGPLHLGMADSDNDEPES